MKATPVRPVRFGPGLIGSAIALGSLIAVGVVSRWALLTTAIDGIWALALLAPGMVAGLGAWLAGRRLWCQNVASPVTPARDFLAPVVAITLGIGGQMLLALLTGWLIGVGRVSLGVVLGVLTVAGLAGIAWSRRAPAGATVPDSGTPAGLGPAAPASLWLLAGPFLVIALLAAAHAPGYLWAEEAFGYDVLEYHLQVPREYLQAGAIHYLPHNVYANFPMNVEMLYLQAMMLLGTPAESGCIAHLLHACLGGLAVALAWAVGRRWSPMAGAVAGVSLATAGWLPYLAGLAYVELGMLAFGLAAVGAVLASGPARGGRESWGLAGVIAGGLLAGLACGCKYTAVPMFALPLAIAAAMIVPGRWHRRLGASLLFLLMAGVSFAPWLIKNAAFTGNPVFPLANSIFDAYPPGWDAAAQQRWDVGHAPEAGACSPAARLTALGRRVVADPAQRFGPVLLGLGVLGLLGRRLTRVDAALLLLLAAQLAVWLFATHLFARFAVVLLVPLCLLAGRSLGDANGPAWRRTTVALLLVAGAAWNATFLVKLYRHEAPGMGLAEWLYTGELAGAEAYGYVNEGLPADARVLLVGEARAFYYLGDVDYHVVFNRQPLAEQLATATRPAEVVEWLRAQGYTHVLVNWSEVHRLQCTYGLPAELSPAAFAALQQAGLENVQDFRLSDAAGTYIEAYEVPPS